MDTRIRVSVALITYNHESFISKAIESVLMQEMNYDLEFVIGEDFSTDNTSRICEEFAMMNNKIKLLKWEKNLGASMNFAKTLESCTGKYIAVLEGDDYWIDSGKLKKQVEFLELNPAYSMCFTNRMIVDREAFSIIKDSLPVNRKRDLSFEDILSGITPPLLTVLFRKSCIENKAEFFSNLSRVFNGDTFLFSFLSVQGPVGYIDMISAAYRLNENGIYGRLNYVNRLMNRGKTFELLLETFPAIYHKYLSKGFKIILQRLFVINMVHYQYRKAFHHLFYLVRLDFKTKDFSALRAIKLLIKSMINKEFIIAD